MAFTQDNRQLSIITPLGENVLLFRSMDGHESLSDLFEFTIDLQSEQKNIAFEKIIGKTVTVVLRYQNGGKRYFNGIVCRFSYSGKSGPLSNYRAIVRPWAWLLTRSSDCCIFQNKSVIDIIKEICQKPEYRSVVNLDESLLCASYPKLEYCVQYRETDYHFISRLLEYAGIYFFFRHEEKKHTMVLIDSSRSHFPQHGYEEIKFAADEQQSRNGEERITLWERSGEIQSSGFELNDFDFETARNSTLGSLRAKETILAPFGQPIFQQYDYPGEYVKQSEGQRLATARIEELHGQSESITAVTNARGLACGALFSLDGHPVDEHNREYLVTSARYFLSSDDYLASNSGKGGELVDIHFNATGTQYRFRPPPKAFKTIVTGPQTAIVVGKAGEEIWTDRYGRVKVQFHWDRKGKHDEESSCWVRVSQSWAGRRWGALTIPRVGMEVVVEFLEGDPDRPLITGCVYNSDTMPPYALPANQTRTTLKTNSSKDGGGFNEIRFEDKKGEEEIFIQAEKDQNRVVKHNDTLKVGFEYKQPGSQTVEIKHDQKTEIGNDQITHVVKDQSVVVDGKQIVTVGDTAQVEARNSLLFKVGGSSILLEPGKITIKSGMIALEASGLGSFKATPIKLN